VAARIARRTSAHRAPGQAHADAVLADDRCRDHRCYWSLWVRCPACRTTNAIDLRTLDRHRDVAVTSLIPSLSPSIVPAKRAVRELVRLSRTSIAGEMGEAHTRRTVG
jgi:hypothetical protein